MRQHPPARIKHPKLNFLSVRFLVAFRPLKTLATSRNPLIKKQRREAQEGQREAQEGQCMILELFRGGSASD